MYPLWRRLLRPQRLDEINSQAISSQEQMLCVALRTSRSQIRLALTPEALGHANSPVNAKRAETHSHIQDGSIAIFTHLITVLIPLSG